MGLLQLRGEKKKKKKGLEAVQRLCSQRLFCRGNAFPFAGSHFWFSYTELLFLNCAEIQLNETCLRQKKKKKKNHHLIAVYIQYIDWSHILWFSMSPHSHRNLFKQVFFLTRTQMFAVAVFCNFKHLNIQHRRDCFYIILILLHYIYHQPFYHWHTYCMNGFCVFKSIYINSVYYKAVFLLFQNISFACCGKFIRNV